MSDPPVQPPEDPEQWSDEQWLEWLEDTDVLDAEAGGQDEHPRVVAHWRDRPAATVLGAAMLGLRDAIYGHPDDEVVIVQDASGDPPDDGTPVVRLDPEHPERSEVVVPRPENPAAAPGGSRRLRRRRRADGPG
jgi:hypothetical protein